MDDVNSSIVYIINNGHVEDNITVKKGDFVGKEVKVY